MKLKKCSHIHVQKTIYQLKVRLFRTLTSSKRKLSKHKKKAKKNRKTFNWNGNVTKKILYYEDNFFFV